MISKANGQVSMYYIMKMQSDIEAPEASCVLLAVYFKYSIFSPKLLLSKTSSL